MSLISDHPFEKTSRLHDMAHGNTKSEDSSKDKQPGDQHVLNQHGPPKQGTHHQRADHSARLVHEQTTLNQRQQ